MNKVKTVSRKLRSLPPKKKTLSVLKFKLKEVEADIARYTKQALKAESKIKQRQKWKHSARLFRQDMETAERARDIRKAERALLREVIQMVEANFSD